MLTSLFFVALPYSLTQKINPMRKILRRIWQWLKSLFYFPPPEPDTDTKEDAPEGPSVEPPKDRLGFDPMFLPVRLSLPTLEDGTGTLLHYRHFSVALNPERRMPYYTAVNIDAERYNRLKDQIPTREEMGRDNWVLDKRVAREQQLPESFYNDNDFDLGHMVRREDVLWGDNLEQVLAANDDTFYLTNATPQHKDFNRSAQRWKGLEDYALKNARKNNLRVSVFSGCVFNEADRQLNGVQIPGKFWKILVMVRADGALSATGYLIQQDDLIESITEREIGFRYEQFKTYQVSIAQIEAATGLRFHLNDYDPLQKIGTRGGDVMPVAVDVYEDIVF